MWNAYKTTDYTEVHLKKSSKYWNDEDKCEVKESAVVKPAPAKPRSTIWISNLDAILPENYHTRTHIFYRPTAVPDFFDAAVLKAALARTLSEFYPIAGRLQRDAKGRIEIDCNGEGAAFVEAEAEADLDDLGDFAPHPDICLTPKVDYSQGISSFPLLLVQVYVLLYFKIEKYADNI